MDMCMSWACRKSSQWRGWCCEEEETSSGSEQCQLAHFPKNEESGMQRVSPWCKESPRLPPLSAKTGERNIVTLLIA